LINFKIVFELTIQRILDYPHTINSKTFQY